MIPFDGRFAEDVVYPLAHGAYDADNAPPNFVINQTAFPILADVAVALQSRAVQANPKHRKPLDSMLKHPRKPRITDASRATTDAVKAMPPAAQPNQHFGWVCVDAARKRLIVTFRGTEYFQDWLDDFDFSPAPYSPVPGRGTVHQGFLIVYEAVRASLRATVEKILKPAATADFQQILITGHSLGGALTALCAPDLLNDLAAHLAPTIYTWAEPRVGHPDFVRLFETRVNVCYRIVNLWDVVPHLPPVLALYEHEGSSLHIDSGFSFDIVRNHVLLTGYLPGIQKWNAAHPAADTRLGVAPLVPMVGKSA